MIPTEIAMFVLACVFGGTLIGMFLHVLLPEHHLSEDTKDVIKLGTGLIATMTALVLGLMIAPAKNSYDTQNEAVKHTAAKVLLLDRMLSNYGPETKEARDMLRRTVARPGCYASRHRTTPSVGYRSKRCGSVAISWRRAGSCWVA